MRWFVIGGKGFIGQEIVLQLKAAGKDVDWFDPKEYQRKEIPMNSRVIDCAARAGIESCERVPRLAFESNVVRPCREIDREYRHYSFFSSAAAAAPENIYAATKAMAEQWITAYARARGISYTILRPGNVYGPGSLHKNSVIARWCKDAIEHGRITVDGDGSQERDFVHVRDVASIAVLSTIVPLQGTYSIRTGKLTPLRDLAEFMGSLTGAEVVYGPARATDSAAPVDKSEIIEFDYTDIYDGITDTWNWFKTHLSPQEKAKCTG